MLPENEKRAVFSRLIPPELFERFKFSSTLIDAQGNELLLLDCEPGCSDAEMRLFHQAGFPDPILYGHITDTVNGQIHVLLYVLNDPDSPRFDVDRMPNGTPTKFGTINRNLGAELSAMEYGLAPGQVRHGLRLLGSAIEAFDHFVSSLGQVMYFNEPLYYHNAIIFERYGFTYARGRRLMERIQQGFAPGGDLCILLDGSTPFRKPEAAQSIRLRSWAIHDNIMGEPFNSVTMYKRIGVFANLDTCPGINW
jgi:hypothetical protein